MAGYRLSVRFIAVVTVLASFLMISLNDDDRVRRRLQEIYSSSVVGTVVNGIFIWPWMLGRAAEPEPVLFMSFPNSGSMYALASIQLATDYSAASLYGKEYVDLDGVADIRYESVQAYPELTSGPYLTSNLTKQFGGLLPTRTYCGGHCLSHCTCEEYDITLEQFEQECALTEDADTLRDFLHESIINAKAVLMLRNPFENIVSRFNYEYRLNDGDGSNSHFREWEKDYVKDHNGFKEWCAFIDDANEFTNGQCFADDPTLLALMEQVPCHSEFYKYVHWYNNVFELLSQVKIEPQNLHILIHEDLFLAPNNTIKALTDFLRMDNNGKVFDFVYHDYTYYYNLTERTKILDLITHIATEDTQHHMRRYLIYPTE